ncbi:MAG: DUF3108 domain-containing protein [Akkermansiaceae bacterium]
MKKTPLPLLAAVTTSLALFSITAHADTSWMNKVKPFKNGSHPKLKPTKLEYELSWKGTVKAGELTFDFNKKDKRYKGLDISQAYGRSQNLAYAVFPYHISMTSFAKETTHKPLIFVADEKDKREKIKTTNTFKSNGVHFVAKEENFIEKKTKNKNHHFKFANSHDPLSAIQYIRRQSLKNGEKIYLCLHPFASPMFSEITVLGRENHNGRRCIKLDVKLQKIDKDTMHLKTYKKLKKATLWISDDVDRVMVELRSQVFIGDVRMVLKKQSPL